MTSASRKIRRLAGALGVSGLASGARRAMGASPGPHVDNRPPSSQRFSFEHAPWSFPRRLAVWLTATALFTASAVQYSRRAGRLLIGPFYDDLGYFLDAIARLRHFDDSGVWSWVREWAERPPHSPSHTILAAVSYATLGTYDWAPYVGNGLVVLVLLLGVDWLQAGASMTQRPLVATFVLTVPMAQIAVSDFRPDVLAGITTALGDVIVAAAHI